MNSTNGTMVNSTSNTPRIRAYSAAGAKVLAARYAAAAAKPPAFATLEIGIIYHVASYGFTIGKKKWVLSSISARQIDAQ